MRMSEISANHLLGVSRVSSFLFIPYCHLIPLLLSVKIIEWLNPSINVMDDEYKFMYTRPKGCEVGSIDPSYFSKACMTDISGLA
jgi:hypothetical protein